MSACMKLAGTATASSATAAPTKTAAAKWTAALLLGALGSGRRDDIRIVHAGNDLVAFLQPFEDFGKAGIGNPGLDFDFLDLRFSGRSCGIIYNIDGASHRTF